jgi:hypothetical protein
MTTDVIFYTTMACHLCEQAEVMLASLLPSEAITRVDVAEDDDLLARYSTRIPVVVCRKRELTWPFSLLDLREFILSRSGT